MANSLQVEKDRGKLCEGVFDWKVKDFLKSGDAEQSPSFFHRGNACFLRLLNINYPKAARIELNVTANNQAINLLKNMTYFKACFLSRDGEEHYIQEMYIRQWELKFCVMFCSEEICRSIIENIEEFLVEDKFTFRLVWNCHRHRLVPMPVEDDTFSEKANIKSLWQLSADFGRLFYSKTDTDCLLKVGDVEIPVHRAVLSARSEVFAAMFRHDSTESLSGLVDIPDVDATILNNMIHYVYSGEIRGLSKDTAVPMYVAADKYAVIGLVDECLNFMKHYLTIENVCEIARLAQVHGLKCLQNSVSQFIMNNLEVLELSNK